MCIRDSEEPVLEAAYFIGSTSALLRYAAESTARQLIVATEPGILHQMRQLAPEKELIPAPSNQSCACNNCPHMKLNTLEKLYTCLLYEQPELLLPPHLIEAARRPIDRMLTLSQGIK
jgi:quinolinate synthase